MPSAIFLFLLSLVNCAIAGTLIGQLQLATTISYIKVGALVLCISSAVFGFWTVYNQIKEQTCSRG